ncbi:MAG: sporulation transcriptional regulator SpoIIID [Clostridia bacterium]|nr:sporulation transcriptional regulator SpoIIID [Clostridia bacterium]
MYISSEKERCVLLANYLIENHATVRAAAARFGISKSTVHKDVTQVLPRVNRALYIHVKEVLDKNKQERHLRGGMATRQKYLGETEIKG